MTDRDFSPWGPLRDRYEQNRPRRMLALDGGGIRGLMTLKLLSRLEQLLREKYGTGDRFRLCHFFDFVGGTSTGAIIAAAIAIGMSVDEILKFYRTFGQAAFTKRAWYERWKSLYGGGPLQEMLTSVYGREATLEPQYLKTLLLVVTRNATTDSAWPLSSNPFGKYNDVTRADCNLKIPLWQLVRASAAAPVYFPPEVIEWQPGNPDRAFVFVDGGTTAYNNPAFCMARMATEPAYRLNWQRGERNLLIVSMGTGFQPTAGNTAETPESSIVSTGVSTVSALMNQAAFDQDVNCRTVGRCTFGHRIDGEVLDLVPRETVEDPNSPQIPLHRDLGRSFLYARYNVLLSREELNRLGLPDMDPDQVAKLDSTDATADLERLGDRLAEQIDMEQLGGFTDEPLFEVL